MRLTAVCALGIAGAAMAGGQAGAWLLYPGHDDPARMIVEVERPYGDFVAFGSLPPPFNTAFQTMQGPKTFSYRWRYGRVAQGMAFLNVDARRHRYDGIRVRRLGAPRR